MQVPKRKSEQTIKYHHDPYLSLSKIKELKIKLERILLSRPKLSQEVKLLALDGDFSENAPYQLAKSRLRGLNRRILSIKKQLETAVIITKPKNNYKIGIGGTVEIQYKNIIKRYTILGSNETNPLEGIISYQSPLGAKLLNKQVGDSVDLKQSGEEKIYTIIRIY